MDIRPFDWRDLPALLRLRHESVFLHSSLVLTRGPMMMTGALLSYLAPSMGMHTATSNGDREHQMIGQFIVEEGAPFAHLTFLTPESALDSSTVLYLLDHLSMQAGSSGVYRLMADVDERSLAYEALRNTGFAVYTRQRVWQISAETNSEPSPDLWRAAVDQDSMAVRSLVHNLVPGMVQQVELGLTDRLRGFVYQKSNDLLAYAELKYGHRGIWVQPFFHPDVEQVDQLFFDLLVKLPSRRSRPVFICIRSYQSWLESAIDNIGAEPGPMQAVMVKHLAIQKKAARVFALPAIEGGHPEVSAPIARSERK